MCVGWKKSLLVRVETHRFGLSQRKKQRDQLVPGSDVIIFWHFFLPLFLLSLSSLPQLSGPGRAGVGDVQSCAASRGRLPSSRHSALSLSLALPLSQRKPLCDSSQRTLSEPNTASPAPGGERERELGWKGNEGRGQHGKRSEETPPNKE